MAYHDTLFQLGMDLTRSSTAQKEDHGNTARLVREDRSDFYLERDGVRFAGAHAIVDLFGARRLDDLEHIERTLRRCAQAAGAAASPVHFQHSASNGGFSGVAVFAEGHISFQSWPEADYAALDVMMRAPAQPHLTADVLRDAFEARHVLVKELRRGQETDVRTWRAAPHKARRAKSTMRRRAA
ncbi:MAG: adenosylmethionine decarboxylase [Hyphomicrobiaceae bacterium]